MAFLCALRPEIVHHISTRTVTAAACLALLSCSNDAQPVDQSADASPIGESATPNADVNILDGHWSGSWGGGADGDVVFQPVLAELVIEGDRVELSGFPDAQEVTGTIRYHSDAKRIVMTGDGDQVFEYMYDVNGDELTLTGRDGRTISLLKRRQEQDESAREGPPVP